MESSYGDKVLRHSRDELLFFKKRAATYIAGLKHLESCKDSFRHLKILTVYSLYIQKTILYVKENCNCTVNQQIHTHNTRNNKDHHIYGHNLEIYNSQPSAAGCIYYNKLPNNIKQIENTNQFKKKLKELLIKGCYYTIRGGAVG
jgi:hypothetical protein